MTSRALVPNLTLICLILSVFPAFGQDTSGRVASIYPSQLFQSLRYRNVGPAQGGRVTAVAGIPSQPSTFYMGATGGGVWKTTDHGKNWRNVSDGYFQSPSIGAIRVALSDPDIVWVGTGSDGLRSNVITGRGVYRSSDGGDSWQFKGLHDVGQIGAVLIHPADTERVYIAAIGHAFGPSSERGVYRSRDGGSSWEKVLYISEQTGAVDLEFAPDDPHTLYASMWRAERKPWTIISGGSEGGVYRSTDGGNTWNQLGGGLPQGVVGKSDLAVSAADPNRLYVLIEAAQRAGLYRSDDRGNSFQLVSDQDSLLDRPFYYTNVDADPNNADVLYVNSTRFFKSEDAGKNWTRRSTPHGDNHDMWINPNDSNLFIQSNDGGANVTLDGGKTWSSQHNQPTAELYQVNVDDNFPYWLYAGQQDDGTIRVPSLPPYDPPAGVTSFWQAVGGCETGPAVPRPGDPDIVYSNCKGRFGRYNHRTGQEQHYYVGAANMYGHNPADLAFRFQRVSPIHVSPHDPNVVYHASQFLHRTTDEGVTWEKISPDLTAFEADKQVISGSPITRDITGEEFYSAIYAVAESPLQKGLIWVGANDGPVHVTRDGGQNWESVTPASLPAGGRVQTVEASSHRAEKAYLAIYRYLLGDWQPYIHRTNDYGQTWMRLTDGRNGIPVDFPTRVIREDPDRERLLYAGTEFGMFVSFDDGAQWQPLQLNLPVTPVTDLKVHRQDLVVSTMGRSFWILDNLTPLHQLSEEVARADFFLFEPRPAYRLRYEGRHDSAGVEYPDPGVLLDYYLADTTDLDVELDILHLDGRVLRSFSSAETVKSRPDGGSGMRASPRTASPSTLSKEAGMHRFRWDLRHASAENDNGEDGPLVVPGSYLARLTVGKWSSTRSFQVLMDPREAAEGITRLDLVAQESLSLQLRDLLSAARQLSGKLTAARKSLAEKGLTDQASKLAEIEARVATATEMRYPTPRLVDQIDYLYSMLDQADQKPGRDAYQRYQQLKAVLAEETEAMEAILESSD